MKKIITFCAIIFPVVSIFAQSFQLFYPVSNNGEIVRKPIRDGDTLTIKTVTPYGTTGAKHIPIDIYNSSDSVLTLYVKNDTSYSLLANSLLSFCSGTCMDLNRQGLGTTMSIQAGDTASEFDHDDVYMYIDYIHPNVTQGGKSVVRFLFNDTFDTTNKASFVLVMEEEVTSGTRKYDKTGLVQVSAYPNPVAGGKVSLQYNLNTPLLGDCKLVLRGLSGNVLKEFPLQSSEGLLSIDVSPYSSGLYFYSLELDNKILITKKLSIQ